MFSVLFGPAPPHTPLSRYTTWNGVLYMLFGAVFYATPQALHVFNGNVFQAGEEGLTRTLGVPLAVIGYLYIMGARTRSDVFGLATVLDRLVVPLLLVPLVLLGKVDPMLGLPFSILDPILGTGAYLIWRRQVRRGAS
jgi:hypothetical protein